MREKRARYRGIIVNAAGKAKKMFARLGGVNGLYLQRLGPLGPLVQSLTDLILKMSAPDLSQGPREGSEEVSPREE